MRAQLQARAHTYTSFYQILEYSDRKWQSGDSTLLAFYFVVLCETKNSENLCSEFRGKKTCFIKRLMFIDFSFMLVLLFCLCSGKRSLCIIICERSEMSGVSFWCRLYTSYEAPPVQTQQNVPVRWGAHVQMPACGCSFLRLFIRGACPCRDVNDEFV